MPGTDRLQGLLDAGIALSSELSLDALLQRLVELAAELTGARYAALGVIDEDGRALERFIVTGVSDEDRRRIGDLPRGRGILGLLIRDARPLRLDDLGEHPAAVGFPPGHPPMHSFLGVPVLLRGRAYGNLYLTEKDSGPFGDDDQALVETLAGQAAVAIENARLYGAARQWSQQLEALNDVADALLTEIELARLLELISRRLRELLGARLVLVARPFGDGGLRIEAGAGELTDQLVGSVRPRGQTKMGRILERKRAERVDSLLDDPEVDVTLTRATGGRSAIFVPLVLRGEAIGVIAAVDKTGADHRFSDDDVRVASAFASRAAAAIDLSERVAGDVLRRIVEAQEVERRRLARELHDQTGQELTSIMLGLKAVEDSRADAAAHAGAVAAVRDQVSATLQSIRRLAVELRPKALDDFGLVPALERLVDGFREQTGLEVDFASGLAGRLPPQVETTLYRIAQEGLTNVVKHAQASAVSVTLTGGDGSAVVTVEDDGRGFDPSDTGNGLGLLGMRERLALHAGELRLESGPGGTTLVAAVPLRPGEPG